jgi:glycosyltransferase involved in cell wall biosynthesis
MRLGFLVPARNEGPRIGLTLEALARLFPEAHVVVVNSDSSDDTPEVARQHGATVVDSPRGYARALCTGYRNCAALKLDALVQIDADGQHPPEAVAGLLQGLEGANWVIGSRAGTQSPGPWTRKAGNAVLATAVRSWSALPSQDVTSGFWALDAKAIEVFAAAFPEDVADANIRVLASRAGLKVLEVPVCMSAREDGASMHDGLLGARNFLRSLRATWRASHP